MNVQFPYWTPEDYWDAHSWFTVQDWKDEVINGNTRQGYIGWVNGQIQADLEDAGGSDVLPYTTDTHDTFEE